MPESCNTAERNPDNTARLQQLLQQAPIWRGRDHAFHHVQGEKTITLPTGHTVLDAQLPTGGWPQGALTEILSDHPGQGELQLLLPALRHIANKQQTIALINPPWIPYAPALASAGIDLNYLICIGRPSQPLKKADRLWTLEQVLRTGHCPIVLAWPEHNLTIKTLRRLQLAAEAGQSSGFLFRHSSASQQHSPAALRIQLQPVSSQILQLDIIKCRGKYFSQPLNLKNLNCNSHPRA